MPPKPVLNIYTDGACSGNPGPGGWGAYLEYRDGEDGSKKITKEIFGYSHETTNNQMEIVAAIEALKILKKPCTVNLYTDIIWHWVKGHSDNYGNIIADRLAVKGREMARWEKINVVHR